jgi:lysophospholipase L1-like esterase
MKLQTAFLTTIFALAINARAEMISTTPAEHVGCEQRHEQKLALVRKEKFDLIFIGDSITHGFEGDGQAVWKKYYEPRHALNLGVGGDRTENVLWRIDHGELDGQSPKLIVMMIGTNNTGHRKDKPEEIAAGVEAILKRLEQKTPRAKVLLLGIFPRSANKNDFDRVNNDKANALLAKLAEKKPFLAAKRVFYLNINDKFLTRDGVLSRDIMPDLLHPNAKGYVIWAEAIEPAIAQLMGTRPIK